MADACHCTWKKTSVPVKFINVMHCPVTDYLRQNVGCDSWMVVIIKVRQLCIFTASSTACY